MSAQKQSASALRGSLLETSLPDVMRRIYTERRTGELLLINDVTRRRSSSRRAALSSLPPIARATASASLCSGAVRLRRRPSTSPTSSLTRGRRFGRMLVETGIINEEQLTKAVQEQILSIIYSLFEWTTGEFEFVERAATNVPADLRLNLSMADIILEGVRCIRDFAVVRRGLGDLNRLIAPATDPLLRLQRASLKPQEQELLKLITEPNRPAFGARLQPATSRRLNPGFLWPGLRRIPELSAAARRVAGYRLYVYQCDGGGG